MQLLLGRGEETEESKPKGVEERNLPKRHKQNKLRFAYLAAPLKTNLSIWRGRGKQNQWARKFGPEVTNCQIRRATPESGVSIWACTEKSTSSEGWVLSKETKIITAPLLLPCSTLILQAGAIRNLRATMAFSECERNIVI